MNYRVWVASTKVHGGNADICTKIENSTRRDIVWYLIFAIDKYLSHYI